MVCCTSLGSVHVSAAGERSLMKYSGFSEGGLGLNLSF